MAGNLLAWELYHQASLPGVGPLLLELRTLELSVYQAEVLAWKLEIIGGTYATVQKEEADAERDAQGVKNRMGG